MITLRNQQDQGTRIIASYQPRPSRVLSFRECLNRSYWSVASRRRSLTNITTCFCQQAAMLPLQCAATIEQLVALRRVAYKTQEFLDTLDPATTQRLRPYGCIAKLATLDDQLTEAILNIAMFAPVCQETADQRIELHLHIRSLLPRVLTTFEDATSQLAALMCQERQEVMQ